MGREKRSQILNTAKIVQIIVSHSVINVSLAIQQWRSHHTFLSGPFLLLMTWFILSQRRTCAESEALSAVQKTTAAALTSIYDSSVRVAQQKCFPEEASPAWRRWESSEIVMIPNRFCCPKDWSWTKYCHSAKNEFSVSSQINKNTFEMTYRNLNFFVDGVKHSTLRKRRSLSWDPGDGGHWKQWPLWIRSKR